MKAERVSVRPKVSLVPPKDLFPRWNLPRKPSKITLAVAAGTVAAAAGVAGVLAAGPASASAGPVSGIAGPALAAAAPGPVPARQPGPAAVPGHPARARLPHLVVARSRPRRTARPGKGAHTPSGSYVGY